jgi:hypothetical protein
MLVRFKVSNLFSFNEEVEFNTLPGRQRKLPHHKVSLGSSGVDVMRFSALYGANASGKSNFVKAIHLLQALATDSEKIRKFPWQFKLNSKSHEVPTTLSIEFFKNDNVYWYTIEILRNHIISEELHLGGKRKPLLLFSRVTSDDITRIEFSKKVMSTQENRVFIDVISKKGILESAQTVLSLSERFKDSPVFKDLLPAYEWISSDLQIVNPSTKPMALAHRVDSEPAFRDYTNAMMSSFATGISSVGSVSIPLSKFLGEDNRKQIDEILSGLEKEPDAIFQYHVGDEEFVIVPDKPEPVAKRLVFNHLDADKNPVRFFLNEESDGTKRLLEYVPAIREIVSDGRVFIIDELERSLHPLIVRELVHKMSSDLNMKGQLIFTTHDSNLLDFSLIRPDEVWFVDKNKAGASEFYSLSEFKQHHTTDIEEGYLQGRFGAIPLLRGLKDLNWNA